jgi:hypothetical protein
MLSAGHKTQSMVEYSELIKLLATEDLSQIVEQASGQVADHQATLNPLPERSKTRTLRL